ncbi:hypothetical protein [Actibacterium lipolyticum]|uniref:Uncharacterized protein n=1 Tax=Actibacterium lipolyticum TaxID=1524263 RepID=A0A238KGD9_9RHOB|nr:hypothetical protein [Actibacterium lipolyticum]SMX41913.1 hypothetical protein COL8621_01851 [Actibacterium lipolyticum]
MLKDRITPNLMVACIKAAIILIPSYLAAYLTDKMVYVVPTLAAAGMFAATVEKRDMNRLLDEDGEGNDDVVDG